MTLFALLLACAGTTGPKAAVDQAVDPVVHFDGRQIDLRTYLEGFPYGGLSWLPDADVLVYDERRASVTLRQVPVTDAAPDLDRGQALSEVDWSTRNRWSLEHHTPTDRLIFTGDERNDEVLNVWAMSRADGALTQLSHEPYVYGRGWSEDEDELAVLARRGEGPFTTCLRRMGADGSAASDVLCDTPQASFTWSNVSWAPDDSGVALRVNIDGRRDRANLAWVSFDNPELLLLTDPVATRSNISPLSPWLDADHLLYLSDESGYGQVASYQRSTGITTWLTTEQADLTEAELLRPSPELPVLLTVRHRPTGDTVITQRADTGEELGRVEVDGQLSLSGSDEQRKVFATLTSAATPFEALWLTLDEAGVPSLTPWFGLPDPDALIACDVEAVTFPTHDVDPATGEPRQLHAYLYSPKQPPTDDKLARITAFYGGANRFSTDTQIHCAAGITTLSPAVRGSRGFGSEFYRLNDGDLGGDEIADLFAAARYLEGKGFTADHIGVYGGSHGGYATMRALTFPAGTNGHDDVYPFGFGMSHAGFSDIVTFHDTCNIPDWVVTEAGDPATEAEKLHDRSPLSHVDLLKHPLLLTHGENDSRVPVAESRQMKARCDALAAPCTYVEFPGQGHSLKGLANEVRAYQARFDFLTDEVLAD